MFFDKIKLLIPLLALIGFIALAAYAKYWHSQYEKQQAINAHLNQQLATCKANQQLLESSVQRWKAAAAQHEKELKRKEALVAKQQKESQERINQILQAQYPNDCNKAIKQGLKQNKKLEFHWDNNIP